LTSGRAGASGAQAKSRTFVQISALDPLISRDLEPAFWTPERLGRPSAWWGHVPFAFWLVARTEPRVLVELGTHHGVSYAAFCEAVARLRLATRCYAVDTWTGDPHAGAYGEDVYAELSDFNAKRYSPFSRLVRKTFDEAREDFADGSIDLLHIDGLHTYDAVRHDFETWRQKLSSRAVVLLHDTNERRRDFGVWRFLDELKRQVPVFEFLHSHGLGVVAVGVHAPDTAKRLCGSNDEAEIAALRERFSVLGARWMAEQEKLEFRVRVLEAEIKGDQVSDLRRSPGKVEEPKTNHLRVALAEASRHSDELTQRIRRLEQSLHDTREDTIREISVLRRKDFDRRLTRQLRGWQWLASVVRYTRRGRDENRPITNLRARDENVVRNMNERFQNNMLARFRQDVSDTFDVNFYLGQNPDIAEDGVDPIEHYFSFGWKEGRDPASWFSTKYYLSVNPDVVRAKINPFWHYVNHGRKEGRLPKKVVDQRRALLAQLSPPEFKNRSPAKARTVGEKTLREQIWSAMPKPRGIIVSFSHTSYTSATGGIEVLVNDEQTIFNKNQWLYVHFSPLEFMVFLVNTAHEEAFLRVTVNGKAIGVASVSTITRILAESRCSAHCDRILIVHCLLGQPCHGVKSIIEVFNPLKSYYWVHDFSGICAGYNLLRNGVEYCAAPPPDSVACGICVFNPARMHNAPLIDDIFQVARFTIVSPSAVALDVWRAGSRTRSGSAIVQPHCALDYSEGLRRAPRDAERVGSPGQEIRVAYIGPAMMHKGGHVFEQLLDRTAADKKFRYFHFCGNGRGFASSRIQRVFAEVRSDRRNEMIELLKEHEIDIVVIPSICPETFSYVTYESLAAGCDVLTLAGSGNVAALVNETGRGRVFSNEEDLIQFFISPQAEELVRSRAALPNPCGSLSMCGTTAALVFPEVSQG